MYNDNMNSDVSYNNSLNKWNIDNIREGIERFISENGSMPSAQDFDVTSYLPSARQIQRAYGGIVTLRKTLGYGDADYTKGELRKAIAIRSNARGATAEDYIEPLLIEKFGETYVHTQKRYYKGSKNRYDFLVYAKDLTIGIDIFTTDRANYIGKNIRHKINRYKNAPKMLKIYFVLVGEGFTGEDVRKARESINELSKYPNMIALHETEFLQLILNYEPLGLPDSFVSLDRL